jgi:hypothetical protein
MTVMQFVSYPSVTVAGGMTAAVWMLIGLQVATLFGVLYYLGAKIDSLGARLDARIDGVGARLDALGVRLDARIDSLTQAFRDHVERHAG